MTVDKFGRYAIQRRQKRGQGRPETFDFLGFTHYCAVSRGGRFQLGRKPVAKRMSRTPETHQDGATQADASRCQDDGEVAGEGG